MEILSREKYDSLEFIERCDYINLAIKKHGVRSKAYKAIGIAKSTIESMMKSHKYIFDNDLNQFVQSTSIADAERHSKCIEGVKKQSTSIADAEQHSRCIADVKEQSTSIADVEQHSTSIVSAEQKELIMKEFFSEWGTLKNIIKDYKEKNNKDIIEIDTSVTIRDLPESKSKSVNLRLNKKVWEEFNKYIAKKHKGTSQKNMVEIALMQMIKDKR